MSYKRVSHHAKRLEVVLLSICVLGLMSMPCSAEIGVIPPIEDVIKAWQQRQASAQTVSISWQASHFVTSGAVMGDVERILREERGISGPPREEVRFEELRSLVIQNSCLRYRVIRPQWDSSKEAFVPLEYVFAFDGEYGRFLWPKGIAHPHGAILAEDRQREAQNTNTIPIRLHYRPFHPTLGLFEVTQLRISTRRGEHNGRDCMLLEVQSEDGRKHEIWIDPERDYLALRHITYRSGQPRSDTTLDYREDARNDWELAAWNVKRFAQDGSFVESYEVSVTDCQINNPIQRSEFVIEFPANTVVYDEIQEETYIVREEGKHRIVDDAELAGGATYDDLVATEQGNAPQRDSTNRSKWSSILLLNSLLVAVLVVLIGLRRGWSVSWLSSDVS